MKQNEFAAVSMDHGDHQLYRSETGGGNNFSYSSTPLRYLEPETIDLNAR